MKMTTINPPELTADLQLKIAELEALLHKNEKTIEDKNHYISVLEAQIKLARHQRFGASSEKIAPGQLGLFNEAEQYADVTEVEAEAVVCEVAAEPDQNESTPSAKPKRAPLPAHFPRVEIHHDLPESARRCPHDQAELVCIGEETSEQFDIIPAQIQVLKHIRKKYACPCCQAYLMTAPKPPQPIEKSQASANLLAYIAICKYIDALPLYRQCEIFKRLGIEFSRTTLANWMIRCGELVQPLINLVREKLLELSVLNMDETPIQVLKEPGKAAQSKSYMWVQAGGTPNQMMVLFDYDPSRGSAVPSELLLGYAGALMVDGYEAYDAVCKTQHLTRLGCWAHARRKFVEANAALPSNGRNSAKPNEADWALRRIQMLYRVEADADEQQCTAQARYLLRQEHSKLILDEMRKWLSALRPKVPPKTALGKALTYLHNQWPRLIRYLDDGQWPIDNNRVENTIRPFAVGRRNWLFADSPSGAKASANLYSLIETAKANGLEPLDYLQTVFAELPKAKTLEEIEKLLPWHVRNAANC